MGVFHFGASFFGLIPIQALFDPFVAPVGELVEITMRVVAFGSGRGLIDIQRGFGFTNVRHSIVASSVIPVANIVVIMSPHLNTLVTGHPTFTGFAGGPISIVHIGLIGPNISPAGIVVPMDKVVEPNPEFINDFLVSIVRGQDGVQEGLLLFTVNADQFVAITHTLASFPSFGPIPVERHIAAEIAQFVAVTAILKVSL